MLTNKINIKEVKTGDVFSESSHYKALGDGRFLHIESKKEVTLNDNYVTDLLSTADQYQTEETVGKEDKKDGTPGIRSIWEGIHSSEVFTVCFKKQDVPLSAKKLKELRDAQVLKAVQDIEAVKVAKKGVAAKAKEVIENIQNNPILPYEPGEDRILRGFKISYTTNDGKYEVMDLDLFDPNKDYNKSAIRQVNINSIKWLVYRGVRYIVK